MPASPDSACPDLCGTMQPEVNPPRADPATPSTGQPAAWPRHLQSAPDALRVLVATRHIKADEYKAIFCVSRAGRDWVLSSALNARLDLWMPRRLKAGYPSKPTWPWQPHIAAVRQALLIRGTLPTTITLHCYHRTPPAMYSKVLSALQGAGAGVTGLRLVPGTDHDRLDTIADLSTASVFLVQAAQALPNLTTLHIDSFALVLPPSRRLLQLRHLTLAGPKGGRPMPGAMAYSISGYTTQLVELSVSDWTHKPAFSIPHTTSPCTLKQLSIMGETLTDELLSVLASRAKALRVLHVSSIRLTRSHKGCEWGLEELFLGRDPDFGQIKRLPSNKEDRVAMDWVSDKLTLCVDSVQGLPSDIQSLLSDWCFTTSEITVRLHHSVARDTQSAALSAVLTQLQALHAPYGQIEFSGWTWTPNLLQALATSKPSLTHLDICKITTTDELSDELLGAFIKHAPFIAHLSVSLLHLHSDQYMDHPFPWKELTMHGVWPVFILCLPEPTQPTTFRFRHLDLPGLTQGTARALKPMLRHITWQPLPPAHGRTSSINIGSEEDDLSDIRTQLSFLKAFEWSKPTKSHTVTVNVQAPLSTSVVQRLANLPHCEGTVDLSSCTWPRTAMSYKDLASYVPLTYGTWVLGSDVVPGSPLFTSICAGMNEQRGKYSVLLPVLRLVCEGWDVCGMSEEERRVGQHVVLVDENDV